MNKLEKTKLPSREECLEIIKEENLPENIILHSKQVNRIALFLAKKLKEKGIDINIELLDRASLLHDLDKLKVKKIEYERHGYLTEKILTKKGYPELGELISLHRFDAIHNKDLCWEAKLLNYADKRVLHDKIVSLKQRLDDLKIRYNVIKADKDAEKLYVVLEKEIFSNLSLSPEKLEEYLKEYPE